MVTLITATCDQPVGFALCERWMKRQTAPLPLMQWIVVDDGDEPITPTCGQEYVRRPRPSSGAYTGAHSICSNLLEAAARVRGEYVLVIEHDDYYDADHVARMVGLLKDGADIAGDDQQRYYHVGMRRWKQYQNRGGALCQTGFVSALLPTFERVARECLEADVYGVDAALWKEIMDGRGRVHTLEHTRTVVGIKGLPGRRGLGVGHRVDKVAARWKADPDLRHLKKWIGVDAQAYAGFAGGKTW